LSIYNDPRVIDMCRRARNTQYPVTLYGETITVRRPEVLELQAEYNRYLNGRAEMILVEPRPRVKVNLFERFLIWLIRKLK
jgi:hypothetical protein